VAERSKVVLISGCDSGFGKLIALELSQRGCTVLAGCFTEIGIKSIQLEKRDNLIAFELDITDQQSIKKCKKLADHYCNNTGLWALINNAGIAKGGNIDMITLDSVREVFEVNFFGHVAMTQSLLSLIKQRKGRIINMASMAGRDFLVGNGTMSYAASKRAIEALNDCLRLELKPWKILVSVIEPGFMKTNMISPQNLSQIVDEQKQTASQEVLEQYGENYFKDVKERATAISLGAGDPNEVTEAYLHAVLGKYPKQRYLVGREKWLLLLLTNVPVWISDWIFALAVPKPTYFRKK